MILYANGCSHTAAAEAVIPECFAIDDGKHGIDRRPHPTNLAASWCSHVARELNMTLECEAEAGGSNPRIVRTTQEWLQQRPELWSDVLVMIQWTTWEREEWLHNGTWYQVNASGQDWVPTELHQRYKKFVVSVDWTEATNRSHQQAWDLHLWLSARNIRHVFFSGYSSFSKVAAADRKDRKECYMHPYQHDQTYYNWLVQNGGTFANPNSYHFDAKSHRLWADFVLQYLDTNQILDSRYEIPTD